MISSFLAAGVFVAVPIVGRLVLGRLPSAIPAIARPSLWVCAGLAIWTIPMLASLLLGLYRSDLIGMAGWAVVALSLATQRIRLHGMPRLDAADIVVLVGVLLAAIFVAAFPADPFTVARDMATYASQALHIAHHGRLDVPYEVVRFIDVYTAQPATPVYWGGSFSAWLAQTFDVVGIEGMVRLNAVVGVFSLLSIYGLGKRMVGGSIAAIVVLYLAVNPSQVWTSRQTLSEVLTQLVVWSGLLLLTVHLSTGRLRLGVWAGALLIGFAALVRIDALVIVPFLLIGHALWRILGHRADERLTARWLPVYAGAATVGLLVLVYYVAFSTPYLDELRTPLVMTVGLAVVAALIVAVVERSTIRAFAHAVLSSRAVSFAVFIAVLFASAYMSFVRPTVAPFANVSLPGNPLDGSRSYVEEALPQIGHYLFLPVVWAGILGSGLLWTAGTRSRRARALLPVLTVVVGCSAVYFWNQSVAPDHFWAVRRFVPVIVPGIVLLAGVAAAFGLRYLSTSGRRLAVLLCALFVFGYALVTGWHTYAVAERAGSYVALEEVARSLPSDREVLGLSDEWEARSWWTPLFVVFDRRVLATNITTVVGRAEALESLRRATPDHPVTLVTTRAEEMGAVQRTMTVATTVSRVTISAVNVGVPHETHLESTTLTTIEATGLDTTGVEFGGRPSWLAPESGFYPPGTEEGAPGRWTDGRGRISIPIEGSSPPSQLVISIADTGPDGGDLRIILNGITLFDGTVSAGSWAAEYELAGLTDLRLGTTADVEITSSTFLPDPISGSETAVPRGMQLRSVALLVAE